jgi:hypothetical protein
MRWFQILKIENHFDSSEKNHIAITYIYLPIIHHQVEHFVYLWNIHSIQYQGNQLYLIVGKHVLNSYHPYY